MTLENTRHRSFTARLDCQYLLHAPQAVDDRTLLAAPCMGSAPIRKSCCA